jgi:diguanylate cyclase (GGDEF)-like protein
LRQLVAALIAEPFDDDIGYRLGFDLVSARLSSPRTLGDTVTFLGQQLIPALGIEHPEAPVRLIALLGKLGAGFAEAMRNVVVADAEHISRAERTAWRERQKVLADQQLQVALLFDQLTGLPNRVQLTRRLEAIQAEASDGTRLGVCLINLDWFQKVNDGLGRDTGDMLLRSVALRLLRLADRCGYFLAHLDADEFAVVIQGTTGIDDVAKVADEALRTLREPFRLGDHHVSISASAGIVERATVGVRPGDLLRAADTTLDWAKTHCRGTYVAFDPDHYESELRQHTLTTTIHAAPERGEFTFKHVLRQPAARIQQSTEGYELTSGDLEVTIYTSDDNGEPLRDAVLEILAVCGFDVIGQAPIERGSWFQRLIVRSRNVRSHEKIGEVVGKVERAAELKYISAPRSESDEREANAIARLAEAMQSRDEVLVRLSSIIFIKTGGCVFAAVLTEAQIRLLNDNPHLMRAPAAMMDALTRLQTGSSATNAIDARPE